MAHLEIPATRPRRLPPPRRPATPAFQDGSWARLAPSPTQFFARTSCLPRAQATDCLDPRGASVAMVHPSHKPCCNCDAFGVQKYLNPGTGADGAASHSRESQSIIAITIGAESHLCAALLGLFCHRRCPRPTRNPTLNPQPNPTPGKH